MTRRHWAAAAIVLVCAVTLSATPATAFAAPGEPTPPVAPPAGTAGAAGTTGSPVGSGRTLEQVRVEIEDLYHQAVSATDAYNLAEEQVERQSSEIVQLAKEAARAQQRIDDLQDAAGAAARAQYRTGGLPYEARFMLTDDPQLFLDNASRLAQGQKATKDLLRDLKQARSELDAYAQNASSHWKSLEAQRLRMAEARKRVSTKIAAAEQLEARLEKEEKARLLILEKQAAERAQSAWLRSGALKEVKGSITVKGGKAVEFALAQVGLPYEWGAEGPKSYDCSGLTSKAWAAAGVTIPRTSQEQWRQLRRIDMKDMRAGDLIIYHDNASHVGMYIGDGKIVHSPRPGRTVTVAGAGANKILGVVRPGA
ncbi:C40 family peptidase [Streptomyces qinzhouensis]|uniref:Glycoside hydrolase n=1 Tax=Streptomyces qinzhouensis TaxID=2599401 RepID=A0A5B8J8G8_9ACTN|nr:C40 family peptidase [Streptomyces qinzhouensis]QDY77576.1 glycoside hydrolase [Streptomyces qinzhouensis]